MLSRWTEHSFLLIAMRFSHDVLLSQELKVWAFPQSSETYEDALVACFLENPEPFVVKVLCYGVVPKLEIEDKQVSFDRVLLHRWVVIIELHIFAYVCIIYYY